MWCVLFHITYVPLLKGQAGGQDVETVHQHSNGGCPSDVEY